jgi:hypothetical protein
VALVSAFSGQVVDPDPFPGYGDLRGWAARGVVTTFGVDALVLSRPTGDEGEELAVAWAEKLLPRSRAPRLQLLGAPGRLLGLAGEWLLVLAGRCPSDGCRLKVLSFTRDGFRLRQVRPPEGWSFAPGPVSGQAHEALVPLRELGPPHRQGLGRLVPAGRGALLVSGSAGVEPAAGVWADQGGSVYAVQPRGADRRVVRWSPFAPAGLALVPGVPPLPAGARLVCVCG